jgi:DNA polymerase I-like protein with 3'-5' exonuclease and polymerase domains
MDESPRQRFDRIDKLRKKAKVVNYSALYSVGAAKLSRESGMSRKEAQILLDKFWELNWSIKKVSQQQFTKEVGGYTWLKNPVSGFWYELRYTKDIFSTLNQGTGVFLFDSWLARARLKGYNGQGQFHDETLASVADESRSREALKYGIEKLNQDLKLNVDFGIDTKVGKNYAEVH